MPDGSSLALRSGPRNSRSGPHYLRESDRDQAFQLHRLEGRRGLCGAKGAAVLEGASVSKLSQSPRRQLGTKRGNCPRDTVLVGMSGYGRLVLDDVRRGPTERTQ